MYNTYIMKGFLALLVFLLPVLCEASTLRKEGHKEIANLQQDNVMLNYSKALFLVS